MPKLDNITEGIVVMELARQLCVCAVMKHDLSEEDRQDLREILCDVVSTVSVALGISPATVAETARDLAARLGEEAAE